MCLYSNVFLYICTNEKCKHSQMDSNADMTPIRLVIFREALWCSIESGYLTKDLRTPSRCRQWWARGVQFVADTFPACDEPPGDVARRWQAITNVAEFSLQHLIWRASALVGCATKTLMNLRGAICRSTTFQFSKTLVLTKKEQFIWRHWQSESYNHRGTHPHEKDTSEDKKYKRKHWDISRSCTHNRKN